MNNRRTGKIARLPKTARDTVNQMLEDGETYPKIISKLKAMGYSSLNPKNLQNWKDGGFQEWLRGKERQERVDAIVKQNLLQLLGATQEDHKPDLVDYSATVLGLYQIFDAIISFDDDLLKQRLAENPERYFDLILAQSRLLKSKHAIENKLREEAAAKKTAPLWNRLIDELQSRHISNSSIEREYAHDEEDEEETAEDEAVNDAPHREPEPAPPLDQKPEKNAA